MKAVTARTASAWAILAAALPAAGCTSFSAVRSAEVYPGPHLATQRAVTSPLGDDVGWFWSWDCAASCSHSVAPPPL